uniref:NYN domain-containing protein n=1 Tax=Angiostrongylus cantonensis TaxID=6313 RepID=A0A0K0DEP1_ANGCA
MLDNVVFDICDYGMMRFLLSLRVSRSLEVVGWLSDTSCHDTEESTIVVKLKAEFDKIYFCCDVRVTPKEVTDYAERFQNGEIAHMSLSAKSSIEDALCQRMVWHASTINGPPGLIALVSDAGNYGPTLTALARSGWRIAIFHPPETSSTFLDYADESFTLPIHRDQNEEHGIANLPNILIKRVITTVHLFTEASR